ncbi:MAG TPA: ABC transporter ATP-binding protein [Burkholderiaceae bacterium]|nr:ABC transporter ATP-binding protein [Burkholderiaceae bacterium]
MSAPLLQTRAVRAGYGTSPVLFGIDLEIGAGEIVALLGRNGMGKTTFVRSVTGILKPSAGEIHFAGHAIEREPAYRIARLGLALVPEGRQVFPNLTVGEHLSAFHRGGSAWTPQRVFELFPRLAERRRNLGADLSGGEQQMLAIGRALVTNPRLLILDEATEGLAPLVREEIWRALRLLRAGGHAMLVIDKYVRRLIGLADHHVILEKGRVVWQGSSAALAADQGLWARYLGV